MLIYLNSWVISTTKLRIGQSNDPARRSTRSRLHKMSAALPRLGTTKCNISYSAYILRHHTQIAMPEAAIACLGYRLHIDIDLDAAPFCHNCNEIQRI